jgi:hypothetical protein
MRTQSTKTGESQNDFFYSGFSISLAISCMPFVARTPQYMSDSYGPGQRIGYMLQASFMFTLALDPQVEGDVFIGNIG